MAFLGSLRAGQHSYLKLLRTFFWGGSRVTVVSWLTFLTWLCLFYKICLNLRFEVAQSKLS